MQKKEPISEKFCKNFEIDDGHLKHKGKKKGDIWQW